MYARARSRSRALAAVPAVLLTLGVGAGAATPALASSQQVRWEAKYVALGDSYAAGQGGGAILNSCHQTAQGYPRLLDADPRIALVRDATCAGATTTDMIRKQTVDLFRGVKVVTVTVGGNDLDFSGLGAACAGDFTSEACAAAVSVRRMQLPVLAVKLLHSYLAIAAHARGATILVAGYPALVGFEPIASATADLNKTIRSVVRVVARFGIDIRYVDVMTPFHGHGLESADSWFVREGPDALHPTATGYRAYAAAISAAL